MMEILPNENTYWFKVKTMLENGGTKDDAIKYLAAILDTMIEMNKLETPLKYLKR